MLKIQRLTTGECDLIEASWCNIAPVSEQAAALFYDNLFSDYPETRAMFSDTDLAVQRVKLIHAINAVVNSVRSIDEMLPLLKRLGDKHRGYGVLSHHYEQVGAALLKTLSVSLNSGWTRELSDAWVSLFAVVSGSMQGKFDLSPESTTGTQQ